MRKKCICIAVLLMVFSWYAPAQGKRDLLTRSYPVSYLQEHLARGTEWVSFPAYSNRKDWEALPEQYKKQWIAGAEKRLNYKWQTVPLTAYLEYVKTGNRDIMENPNSQNTTALRQLVLAELAEGRGRFIPQIIDGAWALCEMSSWCLSAHLSLQKAGSGVPDVEEPVIDLGVGMTSALLSWTNYFFESTFNTINPLIAKRIHYEINKRVLEPYYNRNDFWWMALEKDGSMVNNWNVWVNYNVLTCILLNETDPQKKRDGIYKTMRSVDQFINYYKEDGGCEEGPAYWSHAGGMLYQYLDLLSGATGAAISIFDKPLVKNIGNYICKAYISDRYYINYADASAKLEPDAGLIYDFGKAVKDTVMKNFGTYLALQQNWKEQVPGETVVSAIENIFQAREVLSGTAARPSFKTFWLPGTGIMGGRDDGEDNKGFYFSAIGGHNGESHNHNDVGSCIVFYDGYPMLIDIGSEHYTRQTFGPERYTIWTMQSAYHNVPLINGVQQKEGAKYAARDAHFASDASVVSFSVDIAAAYPEAAKAKTWIRAYRLNRGQSFSITDQYNLVENNGKNELHFMTSARVDNTKEGQLLLSNGNASLTMQYDPSQLKPVIETITVKDTRLLQSWPSTVYRIIFVITGNQKTGTTSLVMIPANKK
jgi:hypothetical protein